MNKNWTDRADKDLFFAILSVKNIGVVSGAEWTTIGNQMRALGYGFTNEGCRQHFQGLRRAQHKTEPNGSSPVESPRKGDPNANPITRRPGPGRPRRAPAAPNLKADEGLPRMLRPAPESRDGDASTSTLFQTQVSTRLLKEEPTGDSDSDEKPSKRLRLDADVASRQTNDDEAVLTLASDGLTSSTDTYGHPDYYGEA